MASNRHLGRIVTLQTLYEFEFRERAGDQTADIMSILERNLDRYGEVIGDQDFVHQLCSGIAKVYAKLDELLQPIAPEWPIAQISAIDRNILRIGLFELLFMGKTVPPKVAINEAIELAKSFGSDNSRSFINGVLGTAYKSLVENNNEQTNQEDNSVVETSSSSSPESEVGVATDQTDQPSA